MVKTIILFLILFIIGLFVIFSAVETLILMLTGRLVMGEAPTFKNAFTVTALAVFASTLVIFAYIYSYPPRSFHSVTLPKDFFMIKYMIIYTSVRSVGQTLLYYLSLCYPDGREISFEQALAISICLLFYSVLIFSGMGFYLVHILEYAEYTEFE